MSRNVRREGDEKGGGEIHVARHTRACEGEKEIRGLALNHRLNSVYNCLACPRYRLDAMRIKIFVLGGSPFLPERKERKGKSVA